MEWFGAVILCFISWYLFYSSLANSFQATHTHTHKTLTGQTVENGNWQIIHGFYSSFPSSYLAYNILLDNITLGCFSSQILRNPLSSSAGTAKRKRTFSCLYAYVLYVAWSKYDGLCQNIFVMWHQNSVMDNMRYVWNQISDHRRYWPNQSNLAMWNCSHNIFFSSAFSVMPLSAG